MRQNPTTLAVSLSADEIYDLYNHAPCGYHSLDKDGLILSMNETELQWIGYDRHEVIGQMGYLDLLPPASQHLFQQYFPILKAQGKLEALEYRLRRKDGSEMDVLLNATAVYDETGAYQMSRSTLIDITARKQEEANRKQQERFLQQVLHLHPSVVYVYDPSRHQLVYLNRPGSAALGYSEAEWEQLGDSPLFALLHPDDAPVMQAHLQYLLTIPEDDNSAIEYRMRHADGSWRWFYSRDAVFSRLPDGTPHQILGVAHEVTEQKQAEASIQENLHIKQALLTSVPDLLFRLNAEGVYLDFGAQDETYLWKTPREFLGRRIEEVLPLEVATKAMACLKAALTTEALQSFEYVLPFQGEPRFFEARFSPCGQEEVLVIARDITERKTSEQLLQQQHEQLREFTHSLAQQRTELETANARLEMLAITDGLTGARNHRAFQEQLEREVSRAQRYHSPLTLLLLDIDHFKAYNDSLGHPAGDLALKTVAQRLLTMVREADFVARYGGEEFALILPLTPLEKALSLAERIRATMEAITELPRTLTVSIGVATLQPATYDHHDLLAEADRALYEAKWRGRNRVVHLSTTPLPLSLPTNAELYPDTYKKPLDNLAQTSL